MAEDYVPGGSYQAQRERRRRELYAKQAGLNRAVDKELADLTGGVGNAATSGMAALREAAMRRFGTAPAPQTMAHAEAQASPPGSPPVQASVPSEQPPAYPVVPRQMTPTPETATPPRYSFQDFAEAKPGRVETMLDKKLQARRELMARNVGAVATALQTGGSKRELADIIAGQKRNDYARMNPDMVRRFGPEAQRRLPAYEPDPYADTPEDTARKLAMNAHPAAGAGDAFGRVRGPLNMTMAEQSDAARARAMQPGFHRKTHEEIVKARQEARMQAIERMQMAQAAPHIAIAQAQHGMTPLQMAQAQEHLAMAEAIRGRAAPPPGAVPGAQQGGGAPPGAPTNEPPAFADIIGQGKGVTRYRRPPWYANPVDAYNHWANQGGFFGQGGPPGAPFNPGPLATGF